MRGRKKESPKVFLNSVENLLQKRKKSKALRHEKRKGATNKLLLNGVKKKGIKKEIGSSRSVVGEEEEEASEPSGRKRRKEIYL